MKKHIIKDIKAFMSREYGIDKCYLREDLNDDLGLDSLDRTELFLWCEKRFGLKISDFHYEDFHTFKDLVHYIDCRVSKCDCISHSQRRFCKRNCIE